MSKLLFGNNSVVPVKDFRTDFVPGLGIDQGNYENGTIAVDNTVIRNIATEGTSVINQWKNSANDTNQQVAYGYGTTTSGIFASAFGANTYASPYSVAVGSRANAAGSGTGYATAVGVFAKSSRYGVALGAYANDRNTYGNEGQIVIGYNALGGTAPGSIVIGRNSVATTYNDTYNTIVIGNDHNASSAWGSVIIGGYDYTNGTQIAHEKSFSNDSVVIGLNAGGVLNGTDTACSIAIGSNATINHQHTMAIGCGAQATGWGALALGYTANSTSTRKEISEYANIAIGYQSDSQGDSNISMGFQAKNKGIGNIAIGWKAIAGTNVPGITSCNYSIAIGYAAYAVAQDAVQIGTGDNTEPMTIKYRDKKLLNADGTIPYQRFSNYTPANGQVLYYDSSLGELAWKDVGSGGGGGGTYTLPVASKTTLGGVKVGNGLNITLDGVLSTTSQNTTWGTITGKLNNQTDLKNALDTKQKVMQYVEMPVATASRDGEVAQYIGEEDTLYKPGQFYQCTEDDYPTATITSDTQWANLEVDPWMFANYIAKYYYNNDLQSVPSKVYAIEYVNQYDGLGWILYENETSVYVKDIYKMGITAEGGEPELGDKVYVQLYMHSAEGYAWRKLLVDAQVSVNNTLTSTSTKQALSANQGRILNDKIKELSGISNFLAMWDADLHRARYLNDGYDYHAGDYFIVAQVAPDAEELEIVSQETSGTVYQIYDSAQTGGSTFKTTYKNLTGSDPTTGNYTITFVDLTNVTIDGVAGTTSKMSVGLRGDIIGEAGDIVVLGYKSTINYKPNGSHFDTSTSDYYIECPVDEQPQVSDMYFYDGEHWILLANHSRQIAIDEWLDDNSRNPVENRVVTNALAGKLDADSTEGLYATNDEGETQKLSVGSGLAINNGELVNTRTGGTWGQITGNIESQTDLVDYVASHGGGGSSLQLSDVFIKSKNLVEKDGLAEWTMNRYKGGYSDIFFKISSDYDSLKNARNDLYITIARNANTNCARRTSKMTVLDDCNRFKTNKKFYCWKSLGSGNPIYYHNNEDNVWEWTTDVNKLPDAEKYAGKVVKYSGMFYESIYDFDNGEWIWREYNRQYIKETEYDYFYVEKYYADQYALQNDNPVIFTVPTLNSNLDKGSWGSNFNELYAWGSLEDYDNPGYERCPQFDIDSVVSLNSNYRKGSQYGNVVKNEFAKMECYIANTPTGKAYLWSYDWTASGEDIYAYLDESDNPLYDVPKFMGDLLQYTEYTGSSNITLIERRSDLDYYQYNGSRDGFRTVIEDLKYSTQDFPDLEGSVGQFDTSWNSYWFDYPIKPVRLADCKIYAYKLPKTFGDTDEEKTARSQKFVSLIKRAWSFEEIEADEDLKHLIMNQDDLIFVLPYDTSYIWMRLFGWQKGVHNRLGNDNTNTYAEPWDRHDFKQAILKIQSPYECYDIKMFGARRTGWTDYKGRFFQRLQFNLTTGSDLSHHKPSKLHPLSKILWVNGSGCEVKQGLIDQSK